MAKSAENAPDLCISYCHIQKKVNLKTTVFIQLALGKEKLEICCFL